MLNNELLYKREFNRDIQLKMLSSNDKQLVRMQTLVENLLKLEKLDVRAITFRNEKISIKKSISSAISSLNEIANNNGVVIKIKGKVGSNYELFYDKILG